MRKEQLVMKKEKREKLESLACYQLALIANNDFAH